MDSARFTRHAVTGALVIAAALTAVSIATMPDFSGDQRSRLESIAQTPLATLSAVSFAMSHLFVAVGIVGVAHLLRTRTPILAAATAMLVLLSSLGHAVYGGVSLVMLAMADEPSGIEMHSLVLADLERGPAMGFMVAGVFGLVLAFLLLSAALWRARLGPRWLGPALILGLILEFGASSLSAWAGYAGTALIVVVFAALALVVRRSALAHWRTETEAAEVAAQAGGELMVSL